MKRISFSLLAILAAGMLAASPQAVRGSDNTENYIGGCAAPGGNCGGCGVCDGCSDKLFCDSGCGSGGLIFEAEALLFKFHRADGVRTGNFLLPPGTNDVQFSHAITPRLTLGWVTDSGLGFRGRYWEYDQNNTSSNFPGDVISVDTWTLDLELFERFAVNDSWTVELSGGVRYNEYAEFTFAALPPLATRLNSFDGLGGILGLQATRSLGRWGGVYGRVRGAILMDDKTVTNVSAVPPFVQGAVLTDSVQSVNEIAIGYEYIRAIANGSLLTFRTGYEWQQWNNYSSSYSEVTVVNAPVGRYNGPSDIGFGGVTFMLGIER